MKITMTSEQYNDLRSAIIALVSSVEMTAKEDRRNGLNIMAELHETRLANAQKVLDNVSIKVERVY